MESQNECVRANGSAGIVVRCVGTNEIAVLADEGQYDHSMDT